MLEILKKLNLEKIKDNEFKLNSFEHCFCEQTYSDSIHNFFNKTELIAPDEIKRPKGDTTFFTTAGVQHIETMQNIGECIDNCAFSIYQPCIRSQYINDVKEGVSTSFINFSSVIMNGNEDDFISQTNSFVSILKSNNVSLDNLKFILEEDISSAWKDKKFNSNNLSIYVNDLEVGECLFINNFPLSEKKTTSLIEVGIGLERLDWALGNSKYYFPLFEKKYEENKDQNIDKIASLIDCIRTSTLIVSSGVIPSPNNHGYRARKLLKRFNESNNNLLNSDELVSISYDYWKSKGAIPKLQKHIVQLIIGREIERLKQSKLLEGSKNKNYDNTEVKNIVSQILHKEKGVIK